MTDQPCPRCGQHHDRCAGHNRSGGPCRAHPQPYQRVCDRHGGKSPQALAAAEQRRQEHEARRQMTALGIPEPTDKTSATEAMLELIAWKRAEVLWLRGKVQAIDEDGLVWGVTKEKTGGDDAGTTREAKPNIWWAMLRSAEDQLASYAAAARKAGVDEARVRIAEEQGAMVAVAVRRILDGIHEALAAAGVAVAVELWSRLVTEIVPRELRAIEAGGAG